MLRACIITLGLLISTTLAIKCWYGLEHEGSDPLEKATCKGEHDHCCSFNTTATDYDGVFTAYTCGDCTYAKTLGMPVISCQACTGNYCNGATLSSISTLATLSSALVWLVMG